MKAIIIGDKHAVYWRRVVRTVTQSIDIDMYSKHYDGDFGEYDLAIITIPNYAMVEDSLADSTPTISTELPTRNPDKLEALVKVSKYNKTPFLSAPASFFSNSHEHVIELTETTLGKLTHLRITLNDFSAEDVLWDLGREACAYMCGLLPKDAQYDGIGVQKDEYTDLNTNSEWINISYYLDRKSNMSVNLQLSKNHPEKGREIVICGKKGSIVYRPKQKETIFKDIHGRYHAHIDTSLNTDEELMFRFFMKHIKDKELNAQVAMYSVSLLSEVEFAWHETLQQTKET